MGDGLVSWLMCGLFGFWLGVEKEILQINIRKERWLLPRDFPE